MKRTCSVCGAEWEVRLTKWGRPFRGQSRCPHHAEHDVPDPDVVAEAERFFEEAALQPDPLAFVDRDVAFRAAVRRAERGA